MPDVLRLPYTQQQLTIGVGAQMMGQARRHLTRVHDLQVVRRGERSVIRAEVDHAEQSDRMDREGASHRVSEHCAYDVTVRVHPDDSAEAGVQIEATCSCAMAGHCEHVVAVMLAALKSVEATSSASTSSTSSTLRTRRTSPTPTTDDTGGVPVIDRFPTPVFSLDTLPTYQPNHGRFGRGVRELDFGVLVFDYDGMQVGHASNATLLSAANGTLLRLKRRSAFEAQCVRMLQDAGFAAINATWTFGPQPFPTSMWGVPEKGDWPRVLRESLVSMRAQGWRIDMTPGFHFNVTDLDAVSGVFRSQRAGWFDAEVGVDLGDRVLRLEPLLADLFKRDRRWLASGQGAGALESIPDDEWIGLTSPKGERFRILADRLKPIVRVLIDLFAGLGKQGESIGPISAQDIGRIAALTESGRWEFHGDTSIQSMITRLREGPALSAVPLPSTLNAVLRPYQHEGVNWMQFLRSHGLSGILADDMGLGKTVQTLAHLLIEKAEGRLDRPALIVVPTTLVHNWCDEARRFAPSLRVLDLHGPGRKARFGEIAGHDMVLTTYALLWRDHETLVEHEFHALILDEAQYVKNVTSKAAGAIRALRARHRLCLSGTPVENHLGELWAQFDFLMPGFLGSRQAFSKLWRKPIEKEGDQTRLTLLRNRIRPFMLRRRKAEVAQELPEKTITIQTVELEGAQRDLYETVRVAMQAKVRAALAAQGIGRSHILVLDALLKLRQVCCDPRLVKMASAATIRHSAKLDCLMMMVPELIDAGRRVLVFSQFTEMLDLMAASFDAAGIPYLMLTGSTVDRVTPVQRFQRGEVSLFLISLKAGGVGLNLTAADTVIHYDPWWNPAAENQATDRAHRLGQDKAVFVYKLIAAGTIEERILALQERKAVLAQQVLSEDAVGAAKFSEAELTALFAPLS